VYYAVKRSINSVFVELIFEPKIYWLKSAIKGKSQRKWFVICTVAPAKQAKSIKSKDLKLFLQARNLFIFQMRA